jgi:hypothetical protein
MPTRGEGRANSAAPIFVIRIWHSPTVFPTVFPFEPRLGWRAASYGSYPLVEKLAPGIIGASRRTLTSTFGNDNVEHSKILRFFET